MNPARILVADDDLTTALLMQAALVQSGFTVVLAADGEAALQASTRLTPPARPKQAGRRRGRTPS